MADEEGSPLVFVAHESAADEDVVRWMRAEASEQSSDAILFPERAWYGPCRICGRSALLTEEHLPPRGAFNKHGGRSPELRDLLGRDELDIPADVGTPFQGGVRGFTLCEACNNFTGTKWAREYQEWAVRAAHALRNLPGGVEAAADQAGHPAWEELVFKGVYPGRFVRQVIAMMLSASGDASLGERHPALRRLALGGNPEPLPSPLRLYLQVLAGPLARIVGGPTGQLWVDLEEQVPRRLLTVDFPPLALILIVHGDPAPELGVDITELSEISPDKKTDLRFEDMPLGFSFKPWPTDYRTRRQMLDDRT